MVEMLPGPSGMRGGAYKNSVAKLTRRERVLLTLVIVLGAAVWCLASFSPGRSQHHIGIQSSDTSVKQGADSDIVIHVDPRRLSDLDDAKLDSEAMLTQRLDSPDTLLTDGNPQVDTPGLPPGPPPQPQTEKALPRTVAELIEDVRMNGVPSLQATRRTSGLMLYPVVVEHNLSTADFTRRHGHQYGSQPVKIKDSQADWWKPEDWTLDAVRREVGEHTVYRDLKKCAPGQKNRETKNCHRIKEKEPKLLGVSWAAMVSVNAEKTGITTYNDLFDKQIELAKEERYLYAQEVGPRWLLEFAERLHQPKYFMNNIEDIVTDDQPDAREELANSIFPAFFFGPAGSQSPLHSDASMTRFWILELTGTKLIRLIPPSNNWRADASDQSDFQPELFTADILIPDYNEHPNLNGMIVYETLLEPGDILYIPEGWAHQALNLDWTCMASYNYNDDNNLQNRLSYYSYDKPQEMWQTERNARHFFLPLINMSRDIGNTPIVDYYQMNLLEYAPVSDAARAHIHKLKVSGVEPEEWRDYFSTPVLDAACVTNYLAVAKWLVEEEGVPLLNDSDGRYLLKTVEAQLHLTAMSHWMRQHMGLEDSDEVSEFAGPEDAQAGK